MKIILDDRRYVPSNTPHNVARTYEDCIDMLRIFRRISFISLDYDLGTEKTGFDVEAALRNIAAEQEDDTQNTILKQNNGERRVKEEVPAGRRTSAPKYNIVTKPAEATDDAKAE